MERAVGRGSLGVIFFTNPLWDGGKGAPWFFFFFFLLWRGRGVEGNVFFLPSFDMWEEGKGMILFFLILFFHCGVAKDRGNLKGFFF